MTISSDIVSLNLVSIGPVVVEIWLEAAGCTVAEVAMVWLLRVVGRDWSRVRKWARVGTRELLGPTGTGTVKFHREQIVRTTARISRDIATCKEKSRHDLTKMSQRRSSALRFRAGTGLNGPERFRAGTVLEGPEPVPCSRHGSDTVPTRVFEVRDQSLRGPFHGGK